MKMSRGRNTTHGTNAHHTFPQQECNPHPEEGNGYKRPKNTTHANVGGKSVKNPHTALYMHVPISRMVEGDGWVEVGAVHTKEGAEE